MSAAIIIVGLVIGSTPIVPIVSAKTVYHTLAFDGRIATPEDLAQGQFENIALVHSDGKAALRSENGGAGVYVSKVIEAPFNATHIGVHWEEDLPLGEGIVAYVRTSGDGEHFGTWVPVFVEDDLGPDTVSVDETFAELVGVDKARYAQAKIEFVPRGGVVPTVRSLTLTFLNSAEESAQTVTSLGIGPVAAYAEGSSVQKISPNGQAVNVIPREEWGANEAYRMIGEEESWPRLYHGTRKLVIHHTADAASNGVTDPATNMGTVRSIYYYHAVTRGWGDIGYNALVDAAGNVYEGRYGTHDTVMRTAPTADDIMVLDVDAGHVSGYNGGSFGVSAMGDFTGFTVPTDQLGAVEDVLAYVADSRGIDPEGKSDFLRYDDAWHYDLPNMFAHRDAGITACPGDRLYAEMGAIEANVASRSLAPLIGFGASASLVPGIDAGGENIGSSTISVQWDAFPGASQYEYVLEKVFGTTGLADGEPWNDAWLFPQNTHVAVTSDTALSFDATSFDDLSEYVLYVRALDAMGGPISSVSHADLYKDTQTVVVDNMSDAHTQVYGSGWAHSTSVSGYYAENYDTNQAGSGSDIFEWTPQLFEDGYYDVYAIYTAASDRDRKAPHTVFYHDVNGDPLQQTVFVNQRENGGTWVLLGTYHFKKDGGPKVQLSDAVRAGYVIADAVKFVFDHAAVPPVNQSPVADAGVDQTAVVGAPVSFNASGSVDDGSIVAYDWSFGDTTTGSGISPTHVYTATGTYTVTLTVTDDGGLADSDTTIVTVVDAVSEPDMSVSDIAMSLNSKRLFTSATAVVTITDQNAIPLSGVTVFGTWSGLTNDIDSAITDVNGRIAVVSDQVKNANGVFTFMVTDAVKSGWTYDAEGNVETSDSIYATVSTVKTR